MKPKRITVGTFTLGHKNVQLVADTCDSDGAFYLCPDNLSVPRIAVGIASPWEELVGTLMHEVLEMAMTVNGHRFEKTGLVRTDHASYIYHFDHTQFVYFNSECAMFLTEALPALRKVWEKFNKRKKR